MKANRHACREFAMQTLYTWEFYHRATKLLDLFDKNNGEFFHNQPEEVDFALFMLKGIEEHMLVIEENIVKYAPGWPLEKIADIDRCILFLGVFEILYNDDVPDVVAINEAIELAKKYGNDTSPRFVNGVLNSVFKGKENS